MSKGIPELRINEFRFSVGPRMPMYYIMLSLKRSLAVLAVFAGLSSLPVYGQVVAPQNARGYRLPAEVFLRWDTVPGATRYTVYSGGFDRRWKPLDTNVTTTWFRDTTYIFLPGYYQIAAFNGSTLLGASPEFLVNDTQQTLRIWNVAAQMLGPSSVSIRWAVQPDAVDGQLEIGTSQTSFNVAAVSTSELRWDHALLVEGLQPGVEYWYRITSTATSGEGVSYVNRFVALYTNEAVTLRVSSGTTPTLTVPEDVWLPFTLEHELPLTAPVFTVTVDPTVGVPVAGASPNFVVMPQWESPNSALTHWEVRDGDFFDSGEFFIQVNPVNDRPIALDSTVPAAEDYTGLRFQLQATDPEFDPVHYTIVSGPTNGIVQTNLFNELTYSPRTNFNGVDHLIFRVGDQDGEGSYGLVRFLVIPMNDAPVARDISATGFEGFGVTVDLAAVDVDGDALTYTLTQPAHGVLEQYYFLGPAVYHYRPNLGFIGTDSFSYTVSDGTLNATGTVTIQIEPINQAPTALPQTVVTEFQVPVAIQLTATDPEGDPLTFHIETFPTNGTAQLNGATVVYTPRTGFSGTDSFVFYASDALLRSSPNTAVVTVNVAAASAAPFAPVNLTAAQVDNRWRIRLEWTDRSMREDGFKIERSDDGQGFREIARVGANVVTYTDTGVNKGRTYVYRVSAFNGNGNSAGAVVTVGPLKP